MYTQNKILTLNYHKNVRTAILYCLMLSHVQ